MIQIRRETLIRWIGLLTIPFISFIFLRILSQYHFHEVVEGLHQISNTNLAIGMGLCLLNYLVLTFYDTLGFQFIGAQLEYWRIALASFISYTFSHNIGFAALSGGAVRLRFYTSWGIPPTAVAKIFFFSGLHFWMGLLLIASVISIISPVPFGETLRIHEAYVPFLGALLVIPVAGYLLLTAFGPKSLTIFGYEIELPSIALASRTLLLGCVDWLLAISVLYSLIPEDAPVSFSHVITAFVSAQLIGVLSHIPGGLGVFEVVMLYSLGPMVPRASLLAVLVVFRAVYYLLPFFIGVSLFVSYELRKLYARSPETFAKIGMFERTLATVVPRVLSIGTFIAGLIMLLSGSFPTVPYRLEIVSTFIPIPILEASHFVNSLTGLGLILLSWGIQKRLGAAHVSSILLVLAGLVVSFTKGFEFEKATYLLVLLTALIFSRSYFYRRSTILSSLSIGAVLYTIALIGCTIWLGFFSFRHIEYSNELWWQFTINGDASRFLRASIGLAVACSVILLRVLFRPKVPSFEPPTEAALQQVTIINEASDNTSTNLVYLKDKQLLFDDDHSAYLMYRSTRRCWVALGDPIGGENACSELVWEFRDLCDQNDALCAFYQISSETLRWYVDVGLEFIKLGEEAIVPLDTFTLEGGRWKTFRQTLRRYERDKIEFSIHKPSELPKFIYELSTISDEWLKDKNTREKGFSLGFFDREYIKRFPIALVKQEGRIIAFANVWETASKAELSVDLMRHANEVPNGVMDFLFLKLMEWGKENGYREFNLGMASLAGMPSHRLATIWNRAGAYLFGHGEHFYNFEGIRNYKDKFAPEWRPRYLAFSGRLVLPVVLATVTSLISGSVKGAVSK